MSSSQAASYQAQIARNNATVAQQNATYSLQVGSQQQVNQGMQTRGLIGSEIATAAANGLDVNSGSPLSLRQGTAQLGEASQENIINNSARAAYGFGVQAAGSTSQAQLDQSQSSNALIGGAFSSLGDLASGAAKSQSLYSELAMTGSPYNPGNIFSH